MKKTYIYVCAPLLLLATMLWATPGAILPEPETANSKAITEISPAIAQHHAPEDRATMPAAYNSGKETGRHQKIIDYAMSLMGSPYVYAGISPEGFDCSGFVTHVFAEFEIPVPHSSALQAEEGLGVTRDEARPGDLVIFTGTNPDVREPGHVGIVISGKGEPIQFVHASSNGGVKVSEVEGTRYDLRFLEVRRIL
ncbi:NlpC/P60 family protein [Pontibacter sp. E15-1]|uniref:C40 family peptidase n=1 Tax=Pontibacter sp. E15-1 TaxID=2919918 RepID=UPI001F503C0F|nr:C40 family peptidase [Pontibacter sp. E15-1]MCJ8167385.1 NlpC/P60 family protein [Pontibacter sp. E15-1]